MIEDPTTFDEKRETPPRIGGPPRSPGYVYRARPGLSTPIVTVLDRDGRVIGDEQRSVIRYAVQSGAGADILFAAGTTGEWNKLDNPRRQAVIRIAVEECGRFKREGLPVEVWAGITAHTSAETLANLEYALDVGADAAVVAPLSIIDIDDPVDFMTRAIGAVFEQYARTLPIFLYDNADIAAYGKPGHLAMQDLRQISRLSYVHGIKVTASKEVLASYSRPPAFSKLGGGFALYPGNAYLIFELFKPWEGLTGRVRDFWSRYLVQQLPHGVVSGASNVMPREWQRSWQVCRKGDVTLMQRYEEIMQSFRTAGEFVRAGDTYRPTIACLKAALVDLGVCSSDTVAPGSASLDTAERREFLRRFRDIRRRAAVTLEPEWLSEWVARPARMRTPLDG
jgi:dihydrodipicolinate synthase/N-acetylneuraminate lyase